MSVEDPISTRLHAIASSFSQLQQQFADHDGDGFQAVVEVTAAGVPGAKWASITGAKGEGSATLASTDDRATRADAVQNELGSGPCVDAIFEEAIYRVDDARTDPRWPELGRRLSSEVGVTSMLSFRLSVDGGESVGALNLYSDRARAFDEKAVLSGLLLATFAASLTALSSETTKSDNLTVALESSREIGVAMGVLMATYKLTREQAFDLLRIASQHRNRKVRDIATEVADTGALTVAPLQHSPRAPARRVRHREPAERRGTRG